MSLILEALRKLDRDRSNPDPGVVVVGAQVWPARSTATRSLALGLGAFGLVALGFWLGTRPHQIPPGPAGVPVTSTDAPRAPSSAPLVRETSIRGRSTGAEPSTPTPVPRLTTDATAPQRAAAETRADDDTAEPQPAEEPSATEPIGAAGGEASIASGEPKHSTLPALPTLHAITRRGDRNVALLDDHVVAEGDSYDGWKVIRIGEAEVEIVLAGQRHTLRF